MFELPPVLANLRAPQFLSAGLNGLLFETQWLYWAAGGFLALILLYLGSNRRDRKLTIAGIVVAGLTVLWIGGALLVDTPKERLYRATEGMSQAAVKKNVNKVLSYFGDDFECPQLGITVPAAAHEQIARRLDQYGIQSNTILGYQSDIRGNTATARLAMLTKTADGSVKTAWQLTWEDLPRDDWKITRAELLSINDQDVGAGQIEGIGF
jgi:hypothetical protein